MSCVQGIRRSRRLTTARSTSSLIRSNVNPLIGYRGKARSENELTLFVNSADRDASESANLFKIKIPEGPTFPINSVVKYQLFQASLPAHIYYFNMEKVVYSYSVSGTAYTTTKYLNGFYDMSDFVAESNPGVYSSPQDMTVPSGNYICYVNYSSTNYALVLGYDKRTGKIFNNRSTPITITVSSEKGRLAFGMPEGVLVHTLAGSPVKEPDDGSSVYDQRAKYARDGSYAFTDWDWNNYAMPFPMQQMPTCLYVRINEVLETTYETKESEYNCNTSRSDILAQIPVNAGFGGIITYLNADTMYEVPLKSDCKELELSLVDEYNLPVDLHGFDWQCVLRVFWQSQDFSAR
jgi:hypothetical protein